MAVVVMPGEPRAIGGCAGASHWEEPTQATLKLLKKPEVLSTIGVAQRTPQLVCRRLRPAQDDDRRSGPPSHGRLVRADRQRLRIFRRRSCAVNALPAPLVDRRDQSAPSRRSSRSVVVATLRTRRILKVRRAVSRGDRADRSRDAGGPRICDRLEDGRRRDAAPGRCRVQDSVREAELRRAGAGCDEGLRRAAIPSLDARFFVTAVLTQREAGGNLSEVLDRLASVMRERFRIKREVRVRSAHGRDDGVRAGWNAAGASRADHAGDESGTAQGPDRPIRWASA